MRMLDCCRPAHRRTADDTCDEAGSCGAFSTQVLVKSSRSSSMEFRFLIEREKTSCPCSLWCLPTFVLGR